MMEQKPSVGRIVHFIGWNLEYSKVHRAAIITEVTNNGVIKMAVFNSSGVDFDGSTIENYDETGQRAGSWHWPERI